MKLKTWITQEILQTFEMNEKLDTRIRRTLKHIETCERVRQFVLTRNSISRENFIIREICNETSETLQSFSIVLHKEFFLF